MDTVVSVLIATVYILGMEIIFPDSPGVKVLITTCFLFGIIYAS